MGDERYKQLASFTIEIVDGGEEDEIMKKVDQRARLEQLAEECGELSKACLKLIRAKGNGNPCNVLPEEAAEKVVEECSDVLVAMAYILCELQEEVPFDIDLRISEIAEDKIERWNRRVLDEE